MLPTVRQPVSHCPLARWVLAGQAFSLPRHVRARSCCDAARFFATTLFDFGSRLPPGVLNFGGGYSGLQRSQG